MLVAILAMYFNVQPHTFNMLELTKATAGFNLNFQIFLFLAFYLAFAIKVPIFPFHTWLPDAHVEAPTPISVLLAGVLLKMGGYGLFRICYPMFGAAAHYFADSLAILGVVNIVYGACVALAQTDFKKMIAYSSVSHMGFVILGLASMNATGYNGALLEMFNHGIITGAMFFLVGVVYDRAHTRELSKFGGLSSQMPVYAFFLTFFTLGSLGLPGLSGFVGEFMSLIGAYPVYSNLTMFATIGLIITAGFFLTMIQKVLYGTVNPLCLKFSDVTSREIFVLVPLLIVTLAAGFFPNLILNLQQTFINLLVTGTGL
jgi:NADH-quinone oxidoreductase subunit M